MRWVLESAAGAAVTGAVLDSELQQLGLPKEHAAAITRVYNEHQAHLLTHLKDTSLRGYTTNFCIGVLIVVLYSVCQIIIVTR